VTITRTCEIAGPGTAVANRLGLMPAGARPVRCIGIKRPMQLVHCRIDDCNRLIDKAAYF